MIFYFSGTGNSLEIAKKMAHQLNDKIESISSFIVKDGGGYEYYLEDGEKIGFVFPVYAWGAPKMVLDFILKLDLVNYKNHFIYCIATCGENIGGTMEQLNHYLKKKMLKLDSGFSIKMPNNYMIMGMDVDTREEADEKLRKVDTIVENFVSVVKAEKRKVFQVEKGLLPTIITPIVNPLLMKFGMNTKKFYAKENCTSCGICEKVCNAKIIKVTDQPRWGNGCSQCLACINLCPVNAIEYGKGTIKKGRYRNPNVSIKDLSM
ncbi:EFR1 family ferrodoxin [Alkaliphilus transvaalensis]|uniref:EFR1 family ferrodoxin n=1 Tax=Alkaliphilus transvaalensis TaxID=114628 RepID=UPI00047D6B7D|nr:EFR1 family ferrodoxin [Alkaliphilus transvaalensis]